MADQNDREEVDYEQLILSQLYTIQAVINVIERKGLITKQEILDELRDLENSTLTKLQ